MKKLSSVRVLLCLGAFLMATGIAAAQQEDRALTSVPGGAIAYVSADAQKIRAFWEQIKGSAVGQFLSKEIKKNAKGGEEIGPLLDMLGQAFSGPVSVALMEGAAQPGQVPALVGVLPTKGQQEAQAIVTLLQMRLQTDKGLSVKTQDYLGVTITTVTGEKLKGAQPSYALLADRLVAATQPALLEKALDASAGRAPALAADPGVQRVRAALGAKADAPAWYWMDSARFSRMVMDAAQAAAKKPAGEGEAAKPKAPPIKPDAFKPFMEAYGASGGVLELTPGGVAMEMVSLVNGETEFGKKLLAQRGAPLRAAQLTSANAILFAGMNNLPFLVDIIRTLAGAVEGDTQQMLAGIGQTIQAATGLDPKADFLDNLGSEFAIALNDLPPDLKSVPALLYVQAKNVPGLGKTMQKLRVRAGEAMGIKFIEKALPQGRIYYMASDTLPIPIAPGWAFAGDFLVVGATPDALKSPLFLAKGTGNSLAASPAYQKAVGTLGDRLLGVAYINLGKLAAFADKLPAPKGKDGKPAVDPEAAKAFLKALRTMTVLYGIQDDTLVGRMDLGMDLAH